MSIPDSISESLILGASLIGIAFGLINAFLILRIKVVEDEEGASLKNNERLGPKY